MMQSGMQQKMGNIVDYIKRRRNEPLSSLPFTPADNLIFAKLSSFDWSSIVGESFSDSIMLSEAASRLLSEADSRSRVKCREDLELLSILMDSERFSSSVLSGYSVRLSSDSEQFGAITVILPDYSAFVSYRGTDSTLAGWKEDFEMSFSDEIPSQRGALAYLEEAASSIGYPLILGGHSKGGNIAIYAASNARAEIQSRIIAIYADDSPGFSEAFIKSEGYRSILPRINSYVPQSSIIGMLLDKKENYRVVRSDSIGLLQHLVYSWQVRGDDFVYMESIDAHSAHVASAIKRYLKSVSREERAEVIEFIFSVLSSGADRIPELIKPSAIAASLHALSSRSRRERLYIAYELSLFIMAMLKFR